MLRLRITGPECHPSGSFPGTDCLACREQGTSHAPRGPSESRYPAPSRPLPDTSLPPLSPLRHRMKAPSGSHRPFATGPRNQPVPAAGTRALGLYHSPRQAQPRRCSGGAAGGAPGCFPHSPSPQACRLASRLPPGSTRGPTSVRGTLPQYTATGARTLAGDRQGEWHRRTLFKARTGQLAALAGLLQGWGQAPC